jgi:hypothetical protein
MGGAFVVAALSGSYSRALIVNIDGDEQRLANVRPA